MREDFNAKLWVNGTEIQMNQFVEAFICGTIVGGISTLKGVGDIQSLDVYQERDEVSVNVNNQDLALTPFPKELISGTLLGLVSPLKNVERVEKVHVIVNKM
ncbi:MAG: hypothetical protein SVY53_15715 [Chloroflexota bacterium]|nr:hypothetical protein [Chloroflexota bacterium]